MPYYELLYIIPAQYNEEEIDSINSKINKMIQEGEGTIALNQKLGKFKLSYPIKQAHQGTYLLSEFEAPASLAKKIDANLKLMPEILRHTIISKKKRTEEEIAKEKALREKILKEKAETAEAKEKKKAPPKSKVSLEELDKKLDEILEGKIT